MPPKADTTDSIGMDTFRFILSVMSSAPSIQPDWSTVATENGIGYPRNASAKFKQTMKKYNYSFENNKLIKLDDPIEGDEDASDIGEAGPNLGISKTAKPKKTVSQNTTGNKKGKSGSSGELAAMAQGDSEDELVNENA